MLFRITVCSSILLFLADIYFYIITFSSSFALRNKEMYDIVSIFNDFIFIGCGLSAIRAFRKTKLKTSCFLLAIPCLYTFILFTCFR